VSRAERRRGRPRAIVATLSVVVVLALPASAAALEPLNTFGSAGSGAGQLNFAGGGLAVDDAGNVFVPESNNRRVSKFDRTGGVPRAFGYDVIPGNAEVGFEVCNAVTGCKAGTPGGAAGQISSARGATIGANGNLFVVDNSRVNEFTTQGAFVRAFGYDVIPGAPVTFETCTVATSCQPGGTPGGNPGQLRQPDEITADAAGNLFVTEGDPNHRVSQFTTQGAFVRAFGFDVIPGGGTGFEVCTVATGCKAGVNGAGAGQFSFPTGVGIGANGNLFVVDANHRVSQFTTQGGFVRAFGHDVRPGNMGTGFEVCTAGTGCKAGTVGGGAGQLAEPEGIAGDAAGNLFVADTSNNVATANHRISQFTTQGAFVRAFGHDVIPGNLVTGFEVCTAGTGCKAGAEGNNPGQFEFVRGVATDCRGAIYTVEFTRVQRFGEAGTPLPPCPAGGGGPGGGGPSNEFSFGKVKKNKRKGTAKLTVDVPGAGELELAKTKKVKADEELAEAEGKVKLSIKPKGKAKRKLNRKGKAKVTAEVTYTPDGGEPNTEDKKIKLRKRS